MIYSVWNDPWTLVLHSMCTKSKICPRRILSNCRIGGLTHHSQQHQEKPPLGMSWHFTNISWNVMKCCRHMRGGPSNPSHGQKCHDISSTCHDILSIQLTCVALVLGWPSLWSHKTWRCTKSFNSTNLPYMVHKEREYKHQKQLHEHHQWHAPHRSLITPHNTNKSAGKTSVQQARLA